jgi:putative ABC transport system permease protein
MTATAILAAVVGVLLLPLLVTAGRHRSLGAMATRNLRRRRGEAILVVAGSLLGTAIITSSFVVGDIIDASITDVARTQLGPVDVTLGTADGGDQRTVTDAVRDAGIEHVSDVLPATRATVALEAGAGDDARALPSVSLVELDVEAAAGFGGDLHLTGLADLPVDAVRDGGILLNQRTADRLAAGAGERVRLHAYGTTTDLEVTAVVPELGLAGFGGALVPEGTFASLAADATQAGAPPEPLVLVSLEGGVFDTRDLAEPAVEQLRDAVTAIPGVQVTAVKADLLEEAELTGTTFSELFTSIGSFSVLAGILLLVNLFVMLAEERKTELGMLRALGFTRRRLTRVFALEGALYATIATLLGTTLGVGVGWAVARAAGAIFGIAEQGITFRLVVEPTSLALGGLVGLAISLVTIWLTSLRIARLNVIRAIRDLPEPTHDAVAMRAVVVGSLGVLGGIGLSLLGLSGDQPVPLLLGVAIAAFAATPVLRRLLPERTARASSAIAVLVWGIGAFLLFPEVLGQSDLTVFVVQGVVLTAGAVSLAASLDTVWVRAVALLSARGRGLAARLGIAYPLARRFRTSMLLGMFSLVIFTMTFIASMSSMFSSQAERYTADVRGGYDIVIDSNRANPVTTAALLAHDEITSVAGLTHTVARYEASFTDEPRGWTLTAFDAELLAGGVPPLANRSPSYADDVAAYEAVLADPSLAIVPESFLQDGGPSPDRVGVGDTFHVLDPMTGAPRELTAIAVSSADWLWNGALVSRELTTSMFGPQDVPTRHYVAVADDVDAEALAGQLDVDLLRNGGEATTFAALVDEGLRQQNAFLQLLQAFLGLGLLVGIAGLGVVMIRAVRERRQEIGMLRAMGFQVGLVRSSLLSEAGLIAVQGTIIGALLGLVTARQALTSSDSFGDLGAAFVTPWLGLLVIGSLPVVAALVATAWPASRAARTDPAVALRTAE